LILYEHTKSNLGKSVQDSINKGDLMPETDFKYAVGVDLGATNIRVALIGQTGQVCVLRKTKIPHCSKEELLEIIINSLKDLLEESEKSYGQKKQIVGIGFAVAGILDVKEGIVKSTLGKLRVLVGISLTDFVSEKLHLPCLLGRDTDCAAKGEQWQGAGKGCKDVALITLGTGIGGALIIDDKAICGDGKNRYGSIFGHEIIRDGEVIHIPQIHPKQSPGENVGSLARLASGDAIRARAEQMLSELGEGKSSSLARLRGRSPGITAEEVFKAAENGDPLARTLVDDVIHCIGIGIVNVMVFVDPEIIILGGGMSELGEKILEPIRKVADANYMFTWMNRPSERIVLAKLKDDAGIIGAAKMAFDSAKSQSR